MPRAIDHLAELPSAEQPVIPRLEVGQMAFAYVYRLGDTSFKVGNTNDLVLEAVGRAVVEPDLCREHYESLL